MEDAPEFIGKIIGVLLFCGIWYLIAYKKKNEAMKKTAICVGVGLLFMFLFGVIGLIIGLIAIGIYIAINKTENKNKAPENQDTLKYEQNYSACDQLKLGEEYDDFTHEESYPSHIIFERHPAEHLYDLIESIRISDDDSLLACAKDVLVAVEEQREKAQQLRDKINSFFYRTSSIQTAT